MLSEELLAQVVSLINSNECLSSKQNIELMSDVLMQIKHFYTLIRYENQKEYLVKFMKKMKLRHVRKGEILYKKGVANENLYLILDGLFSLWEPKQQDEINNEISLISKIDKLSKISQPSEDVKHKIANTQLHLDLFRKKEDDMLLKHQQESYFLTENICAFKRIRYNAAGESLNEECVISGSKTQNIAVAQSDSILIYISSGEYLEIFDLEINKLNFITEVLIRNFPKANPDSVRRLAYKFKEEVFPYGSMLFHQEDPSKVFIIIKSGQVEISKILFPEDSLTGQLNEKSQKKTIEIQKTQIKKDKIVEMNPQVKEKDTKKKNGQQAEDEQNFQEYEKYYGSDEENEKKKLQQEEDEIKIALEKQKAEMNIEQGIGGQSKGGRKKLRVEQSSVMAPVKFIKSSQCLRLGIIGPGEILGLEDLIKHRPRSFQAKSIAADTLIYYITKKKIDDIINLNEDKQLKKAMRDSADVKNQWYGDMQSRIQKLNGMSNQNNLVDKDSNAKQIKNKMKEESELTFKAVVQKLIEDRRSKIIKDSEKKRNKSTNDMNKDYNEGYHKNQGINEDEKVGQEELEKIRLVKLAEENNKLSRKNQKSTSQDNQPSSNLLIPSQRNLKRVSDIIDKLEQPQQLDSLQVILAESQQKQRKYQYQGSSKLKNDLEIKRNIFNSNSEQKPTAQTGQEIGQQSLDSKLNLPPKQQPQQQTQNHLHPLQEYENRFTTIFPQEQTNYQQQQIQESHGPIIVPASPDNSSKDQLLRNYKLETSQLSLKQKIQYRIQNNIEIASRFKKYNAESSKGFIETRKFVAKLRQSSKQKEQLSGQNQIQSQKEDQFEQIMNLVNKVNNNTSLDAGTIKSKVDQETHHNKHSSLSSIPDHSYNNNIHTRNLVNNNYKGKKSSNNTTNLSFLEEEQIVSASLMQANINKDQSHPQFPAVISSMSLIPQDSRLHNRFYMSNHIPDSLQSFSQPLIQATFKAFPSEKLEKIQKLQKNKQPSLLLSQQSSNEKTRTQQELLQKQQQQILDLSHPLSPADSSNHQVSTAISPFSNINSSSLAGHLSQNESSLQSQRIASPLRQINQFNQQTAINSHQVRSFIHDISQQSISKLLSVENNLIKDIIEDNRKTQSSSQRNQQKYPEKERLQLPPIVSSSFSLANNLSPQISFSVKMSRKHINAKFNSVYHPSNVDSQNAICLSDRNIGSQTQQNPSTTKQVQKNDKEKHALQQKYLPQQLSYPSQPLFNSESHFSSRHQNQDNSNYQGQISRAQYRQPPKALHLSHQREITPQKAQLPSFFLVKSQINKEDLKQEYSIDQRKTTVLLPSKDALAKVLQVSIKDATQNK